MKIGYARISANKQNLSVQIDALRKFGCIRIFQDKQDDFNDRPELEQMISQLNKGDIVVVWKLDRIGKSLNDLIGMAYSFKNRNIDFVSIKDNVDTSIVERGSFLNLMTSLSRFEREISSERIISGLEIARKSGRKGGRPKGLSNDAINKARKAKQLYEENRISVKDIANKLEIGKTTMYRYLHYIDENILSNWGNGNKLSNNKVSQDKVKIELFNKLIESKAFWSYSNVKYEKISDEILIQKVIEKLDIPDIQKLFSLYKKNRIRSVWKNELIAQDPYYRSLNILIAKLFFNIKNPESYIKKVQREYQKSISE